MKLSLAALALSAPAAAAYTVGGFDTFGRPYFVTPRRGKFRRNPRCSPRGDCTDRAFEDLKNELNSGRFRPRGNTPSPDFKMDEETIRQQEEWIKRAFGLASDVAKGTASSPQEAKQADEAIRQSKEFVDNVFGFAKDLSSGGIYSSIQSEVLQDDDKVFQISFDVPGVKAQDIDVTVEGTRDKILVVLGQRQGRGEEGEARKFSKLITLDSRSDTDNMSANLENGVLVVTVPRLSVEKTESIQKIAVNKVSEESNQDTSETFPFELEMEVPGVPASNIDITMEGDTDKTLTITAVRELGKDSEGNPRTKETSKSYKVDELVDTTKVVATLNNGILRVSAPADAKKTEESVRKIAVNPGSASASAVDLTKEALSDAEEEETSDATAEHANDENEEEGS